MLLQWRNTTNGNYMKEFDAHVKVFETYRGITMAKPGLIKANITEMEVGGFFSFPQNIFVRIYFSRLFQT